MSRATVKDILIHAAENRYGVAAINTLNYETIRYAIEAAERERVPIIVQFYPGFDKHIPLRYVSHMANDLAGRASVPVAVHLDHSAGYDIAVGGIRDGFGSVMVDGSALPFEENIALTAAVVKTARVFGVDVEAELGHVGSGESLDDITNADRYTKVEEAVEFVERTGCDFLAIAVGNAHGPYVAVPNLDFDRIRAIRRKLSIPLVLHGCSDIPPEQLREAVNLGMSKFNIATEYFRAMYAGMESLMASGGMKGNAAAVMMGLREPMVEFVAEKIRLLNPNKFSL